MGLEVLTLHLAHQTELYTVTNVQRIEGKRLRPRVQERGRFWLDYLDTAR